MNRCFSIFIFLLISSRLLGQTCTLQLNITSTGTTICAGTSVSLIANPSSGMGPYTFAWSTGETTQSISVNKEGNYTVSVTDKTPGCQPVSKSISIAVSPTPRAPSAASKIVCQNNVATLTATGSGGTYQWYDAPTGGNFLGSGNTYTTGPISNNTAFYVQTTVSDCPSPRTAVAVYIAGKPTVQGTTVCTGSPATLSATGGDSYAWYDAQSGGNQLATGSSFTIPTLLQTTTYYMEAIVSGCASGRLPVVARVNPKPAVPKATSVNICSGSVASLHADVPTGIINWFDTPTGGMPLISSPDFTTPVLSTTTTYYAQTLINDCESDRVPVVVTVNPITAAPDSQTVNVCYGTAPLLRASQTVSGNYQWYDAAKNGRLLASGPTYQTPKLTHSVTYYILNQGNGCPSSLSPVHVIVGPVIQPPSVSGALICSGSIATLSASASSGVTFEWYDTAAGGTILATTSVFSTPALVANKTYYVQAIESGCSSTRIAVPVTVLPPTAAPSASPQTVCAGGQASLQATGSAGDYAWYDSSSGGTLLSNTANFVTPDLNSTTTYYVQATANGCTSPRTPVTVTVAPPPSAPTASGTTICSGLPANLSATAGPGATVSWYDAATGGQQVGTGSTFKTPVLSQSTTYYAQSTVGDCVSARTAVTVNVTQADDMGFLYPSGTFSNTGTNPTPVRKNNTQGTFSATPAGLVFVSNSTGEIDLHNSLPGDYVITIDSKGSCGGTYSAAVTINDNPSPEFSYKGRYCQDGVNPLPFFKPGTSAGVLSAKPSGLVFASQSTGEIDLSASKPGIYIITNTIDMGVGVDPRTATATVEINESVDVRAGNDQSIPAGTPVHLSGHITGANGGKWTGGTGAFEDATALSTMYTPATGERVAILRLTSADPKNACGPGSDQVTIHFVPDPAAPTVAEKSICMGSATTLTATAPGGTYSWYDAPTGGTLLGNEANFTTPPLITSTTYYVETKVGQQTSIRTAVKVTVNPQPVAPTVPVTNACKGHTANLQASGSTGTYRWYDEAVGGKLLSLSNTYETTVLNAPATYYVEAVIQDCVSPRTRVDVGVNPIPDITSAESGVICSGNAFIYTITADLPAASFTWSRPAVNGISNAAIANQTTATITETLINTTGSPIDVNYLITPFNGDCPGEVFTYVVRVYPTPVITSPVAKTICNSNSSNYEVSFSVPGTNFSWSRAAVPGISNATVSGQTASTIREVLFNTTDAPVDVTYLFNYETANCQGIPTQLVVTVNPTVKIISAPKGISCSGTPQDYIIQANVSSATFNWKRAAVNNISNAAVTDGSSSTINETLINTSTGDLSVTYIITPTAFGCQGNPFIYTVLVNSQPMTPIANNNSPVCLGSTVQLRTPPVLNATYLWTGPNGYTSNLQNSDIKNVAATATGTYNLYVTVNSCSSLAGTTTVIINEPPHADAGPDQLVCISAPSIQLAGKVTGGTVTGVWRSSGTGTFSPASNELNAKYIPSAQDRAKDDVTLTLSSTSKDDCAISTSDMQIVFGLSPAADAGPDQQVCAQDVAVPLNGKLLVTGGAKWSTSGTGSFNPSADQLNAAYIPSPQDVASGSVTLTLLATDADPICYESTDQLQVNFIPPPSVNAGTIRYVLKERTITLNPVVSDPNVQYLWSPDIGISNTKIKNPIITGDIDRTYVLQVTDSRGCVTTDKVFIKVSPELNVPNTFTPNADGINDFWEIKGLIAYQDAVIDIFNRYGTKLYHSVGYNQPWDGTFNGQALSPGTYYYIINTKVNNQILSGPVTILR
ncbi:PKD-like domain-containing protein [Mucilaginibacter aquaedulcis]|uniref:Ig-like domain-containing protein n=1 Tax=Mucilaginibacter aquaedulcis TaxID=1187081 RepID=UPI0025B437FC|nr:PKD-like domain-containing protein [Mucilaginibacter aquaedulcis]MDN3547644.1 gliding motility-associated C-terminal domain-containing protein [Mucilaginibacter aquaedulcis]